MSRRHHAARQPPCGSPRRGRTFGPAEGHAKGHTRDRRRGTTILEQLAVITVLGILSTLVLASSLPLLQAAAVEAATRETADLLAYARDYAVASSGRTAVRFERAGARVVVHVGPDTIARGSFAHAGVHLAATRDSMAYAPSGLGVGASNLRIVLSLGTHADTITVSRLGRVSVQ